MWLDKQIGSRATEMPASCPTHTIIITSNLAASRLQEIWKQDVLPINE